MTYYRIYAVDPSGHIRSVKEIEADSDDGAINYARQTADGRGFEVWNRARLVARVNAEARSAAFF